jgi:hypothetical protein
MDWGVLGKLSFWYWMRCKWHIPGWYWYSSRFVNELATEIFVGAAMVRMVNNEAKKAVLGSILRVMKSIFMV